MFGMQYKIDPDRCCVMRLACSSLLRWCDSVEAGMPSFFCRHPTGKPEGPVLMSDR